MAGGTTHAGTATPAGTNPRIPLALQQIFVASQRGEDVSKIAAPKNRMGFRIFRRFGGGGGRKNATGNSSNNSRNQQTKQRPVKAPTTSSLHSERSVTSRETAADASRKAISQKKKAEEGQKSEQQLATLSPQAYLDHAIEQRGYSTKKYCSLEGGYYCRPTPLQQASYGSRVSLAIRASDSSLLRRLLDSGLSPNPCNNYGESLVHMVCRRGDYKLLRILLEAGCSLQVTDDYGRTPLHDACWRADPSFETVQLILESDKNLLHLLDCRGAAPLSYVKKENYSRWMDFLNGHLDRYWPRRDISTEGEERPPPLTLRQPHSLPIPDPGHALPLEVAAMVANGRMEPEEAIYLDDDSSDEDDDDDDDSSYDSDDSYDSEDDEDMGSTDDDSEIDAEEMAEICLRAGGPMAVARKCFGNDVKVIGGAMAAMGRGMPNTATTATTGPSRKHK